MNRFVRSALGDRALAISISMFTAIQAAVGAGVQEIASEEAPFKPAAGKPYLKLFIPPPISEVDVQDFIAYLSFEESEASLLQATYDRYLSASQPLRIQELNALWRKSEELGAASDRATNPDTARECAALVAANRDLADRLLTMERAIFDPLRETLDEFQAVRLQRLLWSRSRLLYTQVGRVYPGGSFDLSAFTSKFIEDTGAVPTDPDALDAILAGYETMLTPMFRRRYERRLDVMMEDGIAYAEGAYQGQYEEGTPEHQQAMAIDRQMRDDRRRRNKPHARLERRIHDVNAAHLDLIAVEFEDAVGHEFRRRYREAVYPAVYPNPYDVADLLDEAQSVPGLSTEQFAAIVALGSSYAHESEVCSREMLAIYLPWREEFAERMSYSAEAVDRYENAMGKLIGQRQSLARQTLDQLRAILGEARSDHLESKIEDRLVQMELREQYANAIPR